MFKFGFLITIITLLVLTTSCANPFAPYIDSRREAGKTTMVGQSTPKKVSICYNTASTTPTEIVDMAKKECSKYGKNEIQFADQTNMDCSLLVPTRIEFWCK